MAEKVGQGLNPMQREILELRFVEDRSIEEIAQSLHIRPAQVRREIRRARGYIEARPAAQVWKITRYIGGVILAFLTFGTKSKAIAALLVATLAVGVVLVETREPSEARAPIAEVETPTNGESAIEEPKILHELDEKTGVLRETSRYKSGALFSYWEHRPELEKPADFGSYPGVANPPKRKHYHGSMIHLFEDGRIRQFGRYVEDAPQGTSVKRTKKGLRGTIYDDGRFVRRATSQEIEKALAEARKIIAPHR